MEKSNLFFFIDWMESSQQKQLQEEENFLDYAAHTYWKV